MMVERSVNTTVVIAPWIRARIRETVERGEYFSMAEFIRRAVEELLESGEFCHARKEGGAVLFVTLPAPLYERLKELVRRGVYGTVGAAIRAAIARKLGEPCDASPPQRRRRRADRGAVPARCRIDLLGGWEEVKMGVACLLRRILAGVRGSVVAVSATKLFKALNGSKPGNGNLPPTYGALLLAAAEEVAGECVVGHIRRTKAKGRKRRVIVIDAKCLKQKLCPDTCL